MKNKNLKRSLKLEDKCLASLLDKFIARNPQRQLFQSFSIADIEGAIRLAFLRGIDVGKNWKSHVKN